jgi:DNA processing protein
MPPNPDLDRLRLIRAESVGPITYRRLMSRFATAAEAIDALPELAKAGGRSAAPKIPSRAEAEKELAALHRLKATLIFLHDPLYPPYLAQLADAPPALTVLGDPTLLAAPSAGIVGARNASANGMRFAEHIAAELAPRLVIVSGLARGIDGAAHTGALRTGKTIAVVAGGLDVPYPPEHEKLQSQIAEAGAVVAEAPLGTAPQGRHFPKRNRIIAGLVLGLVVIEAAQRSGSLLTARLANEAGRELFGVPGSPLDPRSAGANDLIRQGAHLTESAADVLANLPDHPAREGLARDPLFRAIQPGFAEPRPSAMEAEEDEATLARARREIPDMLGADPVAVDEIARRCQLSNAAVLAVLLELELGGKVETLGRNRVVRLTDP